MSKFIHSCNCFWLAVNLIIMFLFSVSVQRRNVEKLFPAIIEYDGSVSWYYPALLYSSCTLDVTYFPWDKQNCPLVFSSWTYDSKDLDFFNSTPTGIYSEFIGDGEWLLTGIQVEKGADYFEEIDESYPYVEYIINLHRKPLYYIYNLVAPCAFLTLCGMLVFVLPPDSGEKVSMSVTMLLSSTVFLLIIAESMPVQSDVVPLIGT